MSVFKFLQDFLYLCKVSILNRMNKLLRFIVPFLSLLNIWVALAQPAGYYDALNGKRKENLKTQLHQIIRPHTKLSYNSLWKNFEQTDAYPGTKKIWDMYSGEVRYYPSYSGMNREHSFPKSWWGGDQNEAYTDLNHLYPSDAVANTEKNNYPLGEVTGKVYFDNGVSKVGVASVSGGSSRVFEPADCYKGDFARTYFYMVTCYQDYTWVSSYSWMLQQGNYPTLKPWAVEMLLRWHREDPVDQKELDRNEAVYRIQNNRNPFIDYPDLAEHIWGQKMDEEFFLPGSVVPGNPELIQPTNNSSLEFGEVALGNTQSLRLYMKGNSLSGNLTVTLWSQDAAMFSVASTRIPASYVNAESGYWLTVNYKPTALGDHKSKFVISDGGLTGSVLVQLSGECLPVPSLSAPVALPASEITETSYRANWMEMTDVDGYELTRNVKHADGSVTPTVIVTDDNFEVFDDLQTESGTHSYSLRAFRLGYYSPASQVITVNPIQGLDEAKTGVRIYAVGGSVRIVGEQPVGTVKVYGITGQLIRQENSSSEQIDFSLPKGVYMISIEKFGGCHKVVIR